MQIQSNVYVGIKPGSQEQNEYSGGYFGKSDTKRSETTSQTDNELVENCDYILLSLTSNRYREQVLRQLQSYIDLNDPFSELKIKEPQLQDIMISPFGNNGDYNTFVNETNTGPSYIGLLSSWVDIESPDLLNREMSYQVILNECELAQNIGIDKLILAPPHDINNLKIYSQTISRLLNHKIFNDDTSSMTLSISLPMYEDSDPLATWDLWNTIRKLCGYHTSLMISLALPRVKTPRYIVDRWLTEPVSCLLLSSSIFATNQYNYPVLHKFNQQLIMKFQEVNGNSQVKSNSLIIILHGMEKYKNFIKGGEIAYLEYINFLLKKNDKMALKKMSSSQPDKMRSNIPQLMSPLKPHSENLTNSIYSIFETDVTKYEKYGEAIRKATLSIIGRRQGSNERIIILVAGAGRGPLVSQVFNICEKLEILSKVKVIALEKNPQAFLYLQKRNFEHWNNKVTLIHEDMTTWKSNDKIDMCISELLGSFGCNELSPECLWNIERNHSKRDTIFIPQSYTSSIAPITCPLLYQKLKFQDETYLEEPWVMHNIPYNILSNRVHELWSFEHPRENKNSSLDIFNRNNTIEFKIKHRSEIHGIVGYFNTKLYEDIEISIIPDHTNVVHLDGNETNQRETSNLFSWSPMVFPLKEPLLINDDTEVSVMFNRRMNGKRVWYEWSLESYVYLVISKQLNKHNNENNNNTTNNNNNTTTMGHSQYPNNTTTGARQEFESSIDENGFMPTYETGWQSVQNIYEESRAHPMDIDPEDEEEEDINVRVKTGITELHNIDGQYFSIVFRD